MVKQWKNMFDVEHRRVTVMPKVWREPSHRYPAVWWATSIIGLRLARFRLGTVPKFDFQVRSTAYTRNGDQGIEPDITNSWH